jgi:hypothetical protein
MSSKKTDTKVPSVSFIKKEKMGKLDPEGTTRVGVKSSKPLKDCVVFAIGEAGSTGAEQFTIHRPIGITSLGDDEWVLSRSGDIPTLLRRSKDPGLEARNEAIRLEMFKAVAAKKPDLLMCVEGASGPLFYYPNDKETRDSRVRTARDLAKEKGVKLSEKGAELKYIPFLAVEHQEKEDAIRREMSRPETKATAEAKVPKSSYQTCYGPLADKKQVAIPTFTGVKADRLMDMLIKKIMYNPPPPVSPTKGTVVDPSTVSLSRSSRGVSTTTAPGAK